MLLLAAVAVMALHPWGSAEADDPATRRDSDVVASEKAVLKATEAEAEKGVLSDQTPPAEWEEVLLRLRDVNQTQANLRSQQETLRARLDHSGPLGERVRERIAARLHDLDAQDRRIRQQKQTLLRDMAGRGGSLRAQLEEAQADLITRQAAESDAGRRRQIEARLSQVETLLRHLSEIERNPNRFLDFTPGRGWPGQPKEAETGPASPPGLPPPPPPLWLPEKSLQRRIRLLEEQIRFMRRRLEDMESELGQLKRLARDSGPGKDEETAERPSDSEPPPEVAPDSPLPPDFPGPGFDRWRRPDRPFPGPRRNPIPPAGFAPGAEPGLENRPPPLPESFPPREAPASRPGETP